MLASTVQEQHGQQIFIPEMENWPTMGRAPWKAQHSPNWLRAESTLEQTGFEPRIYVSIYIYTLIRNPS